MKLHTKELYELMTLDLGSSTGWTTCVVSHPHDGPLELIGMQSGHLQLATADELAEQRKTGDDRRFDVRVGRLLDFLNHHAPDVIVFEDVLFSVSTAQTQMWASLRTALWIYKYQSKEFVKLFAVPVPTWKAGLGVSREDSKILGSKPAIAKRLREITGADAPENIDEVDAIMLHLFADKVLHGELEFKTKAVRVKEARAVVVAKNKVKRAKLKAKLKETK